MSIREIIYQKIKDDILNGKLFPGERLLESKLCKEFKCSQTPVREVLRQLESEGLLTFESNKGSTIRKLSAREIAEIWSIIAELESYGALQSVKWISEMKVEHLKGLHNELRKAAETSDQAKWIEFNIQFHSFFPEQSDNKTLCQILQNLRNRIYQYRYITVSMSRNLKEYVVHHESILKAYTEGDGKMAQYYMRLHINNFRDACVRYLAGDSHNL